MRARRPSRRAGGRPWRSAAGWANCAITLSLAQVSRRAGLSQGYLSQVERDRATPSMTALSKLCEVFGVPVVHVLEPGHERLPEHYVVRRGGRRTVFYPGSKVKNELLVPDLRGKLEAIYFRAPAKTKSPVYKHHGEEFGFVLKGRLRVTVMDDTFLLHKGDSISRPSPLPRTGCSEYGSPPARGRAPDDH